MTDRVLIPLAGVGALLLDLATFEDGLADGAKLMASREAGGGDAQHDALLDAAQLAAALAVPVSWIEQAAREGRIPSLSFGRWRRFRRAEVEAAVLRASGTS